MNERDKISLEDISRLAEDKSSKARIEVASKLAKQYGENQLAGEQMHLAEQIFRLLVKDAEVLVRQSLSNSLKNIKTIPHDIIMDLAKDVTEVALPVLEYSEVLSDNDLVSIIKNTIEIARHISISKRSQVSDNVSGALIDTKNQYVVSSLLQNKSAKIDGQGFEKIVKNFGENHRIIEMMVSHDAATIDITEKIMNKVSDAIRAKLKEKHESAIHNIKDNVFEKSSQVASMKAMGAETSDQELIKLVNYIEQSGSVMQEMHNSDSKLVRMVDSLEISGKLTPFTALCMGSMPLFEVTMARLAKISIYNVKKLIADESHNGFEALYIRAGLPESMFEAVKLMMTVVREIQRDANKEKLIASPQHLAVYMSEKIMSLAGNRDIENLSYFITMIRHHARNSGTH